MRETRQEARAGAQVVQQQARPSPGAADPLRDSPRMVAQRAGIDAAFGAVAQEDEAPLQARKAGAVPRNETGMPNQLKAGIEALSGMDLADVRVHRNSGRPAQLNALAYAQGNDIHLGPGQEAHLPHEAWHVVQQRQGRVRPTVQMAGVQVNDEVGLEQEADLLGARAASGVSPSEGAQRRPVLTSAPSQRRAAGPVLPVLQREKREPGDLDYGFHSSRGIAMDSAEAKGQDERGGMSPTVDVLNALGGVTDAMKRFEFHALLDHIRDYPVKESSTNSPRDNHGIRWMQFLNKNQDRISLQKQVDAAISLVVPREATKDRLAKNAHRDHGAPDRESIRAWYYDKKLPSTAHERELLEEWVWNAFFRITSKLGLEFAAEERSAIHFNISKNAYAKALGKRGPVRRASHGRSAITHSELRHLKRLHDRGNAPRTHFQVNTRSAADKRIVQVGDVEAPFQSLDMLDPAGVLRLFGTPQWQAESVAFETRLGVYLATQKPQAQIAVQAGLKKMDQVLAVENGSKSDWDTRKEQHRQVFGKDAKTSAGQVGTDARTIRQVIKGRARSDEDKINLREQTSAFYNAALWNDGTTIKRVLTDIGKTEDAEARKIAAQAIGISQQSADEVHAIMTAQILRTQGIIDQIAALPSAERQTRAENDLKLDRAQARRLRRAIHRLNANRRAYEGEGDATSKEEKLAAYDADRWELAKQHTKFNILESDIDTDASRPARKERDSPDRSAHQKSSQDYAGMGVPLSSREKKAAGGVLDEAAKLPWREGIAYYKIDETTGWGADMKRQGLPTVAGNSGSAARLMMIYRWLNPGPPALDFRLALMGWMLPSRDHSLMEIMSGCRSANVTGAGEDITDPVKMYRTIQPLTADELRTRVGVGQQLPEERVLRAVDLATYKLLIKRG